VRDLTHLQLWTAMTVLVVAVVLVALRPLFLRLASVAKLKRRAKVQDVLENADLPGRDQKETKRT